MPDPPCRDPALLDRQHPTSVRHPRMSRLDRAAQFSPFAALTGYDDLVRETARETDARVELADDRREELDRQLADLLARDPSPTAAFTVFVPDTRKAGGAVTVVRGQLARFDEIGRRLILQNGTAFAVEDLLAVTAEA